MNILQLIIEEKSY